MVILVEQVTSILFDALFFLLISVALLVATLSQFSFNNRNRETGRTVLRMYKVTKVLIKAAALVAFVLVVLGVVVSIQTAEF